MNWRLVAARLTRSQGVMRPEADSCRVAQHRPKRSVIRAAQSLCIELTTTTSAAGNR